MHCTLRVDSCGNCRKVVTHGGGIESQILQPRVEYFLKSLRASSSELECDVDTIFKSSVACVDAFVVFSQCTTRREMLFAACSMPI